MYVCMYSRQHDADAGVERRLNTRVMPVRVSAEIPATHIKCILSQGGLTIISTSYISEVHLKQRATLEMGLGQ